MVQRDTLALSSMKIPCTKSNESLRVQAGGQLRAFSVVLQLLDLGAIQAEHSNSSHVMPLYVIQRGNKNLLCITWAGVRASVHLAYWKNFM